MTKSNESHRVGQYLGLQVKLELEIEKETA